MQANDVPTSPGRLGILPRVAFLWIALSALCGCAATRPPETSEFAEIDVTVASGCSQPSALIRELRDDQSRKIQARTTPIHVPSGVYSIGVTCGTIPSGATATCVDTFATASRSDVDAYKLVLEPARRYVFSCNLVKDQNVIRLSESAL